MAQPSKRDRERKLAAKRILKEQRRAQRAAGRTNGGATSGTDTTSYDDVLGAPGTVFLTAPLIRELCQLRTWSAHTLLVARSRGGFWSRQHDTVLMPVDLEGINSPNDPHDAYISDLGRQEVRQALCVHPLDESHSVQHSTITCSNAGCTFRVRFESVAYSGQSSPEPLVLVHSNVARKCDNCLETDVHCLEVAAGELCAFCGSPDFGGSIPAEIL